MVMKHALGTHTHVPISAQVRYMSFTCDGCDTKISGEHMPVQILARYPHRVSKGEHEKDLDLDLHLCTKCYLGAQQFTAFRQFIITKQFLKERTKDTNIKHHKRFMIGLTNEQEQEESTNEV